MGERAFSDRRMHRPESDCKRPAPPWDLRVARPAPSLVIILCCVVLASCTTTGDGIADRRDREVEKLTEEQVWKSGATRTEPQVMPAPRTGAPEVVAGRDGDPGRLECSPATEATEAVTPWTSDPSRLLEKDEMAGGAARVTETSDAAPGDSREPDGDARSWIGVPDEELMRELLLRKLKRWENQAGGYSQASNLTPDNEDQQLARELVKLGSISDGWTLDQASLERAAMTLSATGDREDLMRAALTLQRLGRTGESEDILRRLTGAESDRAEETSGTQAAGITEDPGTETSGTVETAETTTALVESPSETSTFELVRVTFASRIDGPGDFVTMPADAVQRGKDVLVYGEFAGFRTVEYRAEPGDEPTHSRAFSASLQLQDAESTILEELKFLPPSRGRQFVEDASEAVNFWARYQIPDDLDRGQYAIVITAEDHFGGQSATAELDFALE